MLELAPAFAKGACSRLKHRSLHLIDGRQAALLQSIRRPHADSVALVATGLADWVSDLPADEGLVDVDAGTPVRWVEGKGWKKGRA